MEDTGIVQNVEILRMSEEGTEAKTAEPLPAERQEAEEKIQTVLLTAEEVEIPETVPTVEGRSASDRTTSSERRRAGTSSKSYSPDPGRDRNSYSARSRRYNRESGYEEIDMNEDYDPYDIPDREEAQNPNTYAEFEKQQQRRRQMDIENMADLDPEDYDEWEDK